MADCALPNVEFIYANADVSELADGRTHQVIQLRTQSQRASDGAEDSRAETETEVCVDSIRRAVVGARLLFVVVGMGGETGTKAAPVIARIAKEMGILTVAVVTKPFEWEGIRRLNNAKRGLAELEVSVDSLFLVRFDLSLDANPHVTQHDLFECTDEMLSDVVCSILDMAKEPGCVNVDLDDVCYVLKGAGRSMIGMGGASGYSRAQTAVELAMMDLTAEGDALTHMRRVLVSVSASEGSLRLAEANSILNYVKDRLPNEARITFGVRRDDSMNEFIGVTVLASSG